jgi:opacity protein-like surface antigen
MHPTVLFEVQRSGEATTTLRNGSLGIAIVLLAIIGLCRPCRAQSAESADLSRPSLWVGASASGDYLQYGVRKMAGVSAFVDADSAHHIGVEGEGHWLEFHQTANVHAESYLVGPRFHLNVRKFQPYVKGMVGFAHFNFPYNFAHGTYLVVAGGGGVDYRITPRWSVRGEVEYQDWPQFTFGAMTSVGVSGGIRYRVF